MTEITELTAGLKLYFVNAWTSDREALFMNVLAASHQDALDRVIEYWARQYFSQKQSPIRRSRIRAANWD